MFWLIRKADKCLVKKINNKAWHILRGASLLHEYVPITKCTEVTDIIPENVRKNFPELFRFYPFSGIISFMENNAF